MGSGHFLQRGPSVDHAGHTNEIGLPQSVGIRLDDAPSSFYRPRIMGLFDTVKNLFASAAPIDPAKLVEAAQGDVMRRAAAEIGEMAEDQAKEKLQEIAAEEIEKQVQAMLGSNADSIPGAVKEPIIEKATEKVVESSWDSVKARIKQ